MLDYETGNMRKGKRNVGGMIAVINARIHFLLGMPDMEIPFSENLGQIFQKYNFPCCNLVC